MVVIAKVRSPAISGARRNLSGTMNSTQAYHGGDLQEAESLFGRPPNGWLDLSTGINPVPYPNIQLSDQAWRHLPQADAYIALYAAARRHYGVPNSADIVAAPGSQAILQLLPALYPTSAVAIVGPTYAEHAKLWSAGGHNVRHVTHPAQAESSDIIVLVNPNNPDGRTFDPAELIELARRRAGPNALLVIDEAFTDIDPTHGVLPQLGDETVLSIRSFGKFFGLPGLRLGFAAGMPEVVANLRQRLGPWAVSGPALEIGARALGDEGWIAQTRLELETRSTALDAVLDDAGLSIVGGTALFRLTECVSADDMFERLGRAGIFVRRFPEQPLRLRFGIPGSKQDLARLIAALA
jgi:cobalamin biosynthetic protein CobC